MEKIRIYFILLIFFILTAAPCAAAEADSNATAEIDQMINAYSEAFSSKDVDAVIGFYAPDAVLMGTGPGERYDGSDEIRDAYLHFVATYDKQTSQITWRKICVKGTVAWGMSMSQFTTYNKNVKNEFAINTSVVLEKQDGKWVFVSHHFSNLIR